MLLRRQLLALLVAPLGACGGAPPEAAPSASTAAAIRTAGPEASTRADEPVEELPRDAPGEGMRVERNLVFPPADWIPGHPEASTVLAETGAPSAQESCTDLSCSFIVYFADRRRETRLIDGLREHGYPIDEGIGNAVRDLQIDYLPGSHLGINLETTRRDLATFARVLGQSGPAQELRPLMETEPRTAHYARDPQYEEACISWNVQRGARGRALDWARGEDLERERSGNGERFRGTVGGYEVVFFVGGDEPSASNYLIELCTSRET